MNYSSFPKGTRIRTIRTENYSDGKGNRKFLMPCSEGVLEKEYHHGDKSICVRIPRAGADSVDIVADIWPGFVRFYPNPV